MKPFFVANDWHLAAVRSGGTTPQSAWRLRRYLIDSAERLLQQIDGDLVFNGDLFDSAQIANFELLESVRIFSAWFQQGHHLYLVRANHDVSKTTTTVSSFDLFGAILSSMFPEQVTVITEPTDIPYGHVIPHLVNQDIFNLALEKVPLGIPFLFLHCNFDNRFAAESSHSLNLSADIAKRFCDQGITLILGHEHQARTAFNGRLRVVGNQFCSSIADCLSNSKKAMLRISI